MLPLTFAVKPTCCSYRKITANLTARILRFSFPQSAGIRSLRPEIDYKLNVFCDPVFGLMTGMPSKTGPHGAKERRGRSFTGRALAGTAVGALV